MVDEKFDITEVSSSFECVDLTQADLDRGMTAEEIARDRRDLNIGAFCRDLVQAVREHELEGAA